MQIDLLRNDDELIAERTGATVGNYTLFRSCVHVLKWPVMTARNSVQVGPHMAELLHLLYFF